MNFFKFINNAEIHCIYFDDRTGCMCNTVEPLLYDHPQNHIGVVV